MIGMGIHRALLQCAIAIVHSCGIIPPPVLVCTLANRAPWAGFMIHSQGVCYGTPYFALHVLKPSIALTGDFSVGDKVFCTRSNGVHTPATMVGLHQKDLFTWNIFKMQSRW